MNEAIEPTKHQLQGVSVLTVGTWQGSELVKFSVDDLAHMAMHSGVGRPVPLKLGHSKKQILAQEDGQPALGWARNFRVVGNHLLADFADVPDVVHRAFLAGLWKQRSAELTWSEAGGWEVVAIALLGADLPGIAGLPDIEQYLSQGPALRFEEPSQPVCLSWPKQEKKEMTEEIKPSEQEIKLTKERDELAIKLAKVEEERRVERFSAAKRAALDPIEKLVAEGRLEPRFKDEVIVALDAQQATFSQQLVLPVDLAVRLTASTKMPTETATHDRTIEGAAHVVLAQEIRKYMAEKGVDFDKAQTALFALKPELFKSYSEARQ